MSKVGKTIIGFAIYMALTGFTLALAPNLLLGLLRLPLTNEPWIRLLGAFMVVVGYYYVRTAKSDATAFFRATVHGRTAMGFFLVYLGLTGSGWILILFAVGEWMGAAWTWMTLRAEGR